MPRKSKKQQDDQSIELPEDRLDQIDKVEPVEEEEKEPKGKRSKSSKAEQAPDPEAAPVEDSEQPEPSQDDLLLDVRETLISESQVEEEPGFFQRIRNRFRKDSTPTAPEAESKPGVSIEAEEEPPDEIALESKSKKKRSAESIREEEAIQEFFSDLEALADVDFDVSVDEMGADEEIEAEELAAEPEPEAAPEPEEEIKVPRLPERSDEVPEVDLDEVRDIALQEYDGVAVEPEVETPLREEVRRSVRGLRPFERILLMLVGVVAVITLLSVGGYLIVDNITLPTPVPTPTIDLGEAIYPIQLELPGGWKFDLGKGSVSEGTWAPQGPEWLVGTEISRWVALPWTLQLEAVLRTLHSEDQIVLTMSNYESLVYNVYSIQELTMEQIQAQDSTKPGLLVILYSTEEDTDSHWVVTALP